MTFESILVDFMSINKHSNKSVFVAWKHARCKLEILKGRGGGELEVCDEKLHHTYLEEAMWSNYHFIYSTIIVCAKVYIFEEQWRSSVLFQADNRMDMQLRNVSNNISIYI